MTAAMRRMKFTRCPVCVDVFRTHKLNEHIRAVHTTLSEQERNFKSTQQIKKEALLICSKDFDYKNFHSISKKNVMTLYEDMRIIMSNIKS